MGWLDIGALIVGTLCGYTTGAIKRNNSRAAAREKEEERKVSLQPRCLCIHWFNEHEAGGGRCKYGSTTTTEDYGGTSYSRLQSKTTTTCPCVGYLGPDPVVSGLWHGETLKGKSS